MECRFLIWNLISEWNQRRNLLLFAVFPSTKTNKHDGKNKNPVTNARRITMESLVIAKHVIFSETSSSWLEFEVFRCIVVSITLREKYALSWSLVILITSSKEAFKIVVSRSFDKKALLYPRYLFKAVKRKINLQTSLLSRYLRFHQH